MRHLIDLSKLPPPQLIEELDYELILTEMRDKLRELLPEWTGYELESDPANKVLEVAAYREMLLRQRVNEAARSVMVAFARGTDLDHLAAFYPERRLEGANATWAARLTLSAPLGKDVTIARGYRLVAREGDMEATLLEDVVIPAGATYADSQCEIVRPSGMSGNGISTQWLAITPLPFVASVDQLEPSHGGSNVESDDEFRVRIPTALERYSTAGPTGAYEYWGYTADARTADVRALSPQPGDVKVVLLSREGNGTADEVMIQRVREILDDETVRPLTDRVEVVSAQIVPYRVRIHLSLYSGVSGTEPVAEATRRIEAVVRELARIGMDVPLSRLISAGHVSGVKTVQVLEPTADIVIADDAASHCMTVEVTSSVTIKP